MSNKSPFQKTTSKLPPAQIFMKRPNRTIQIL